MNILKTIIENPRVLMTIHAVVFDGKKCKVGKIITWAEDNPAEFREILIKADPPQIEIEISAMTPTEYKQERLRAGLTQKQLADRLGVSRVTINRREKGHDKISKEAALAVQALTTKNGKVDHE